LDTSENSLVDYWEQIPERNIPYIKFSDFIYFSLISATTTGFGDIIPNSPYIRIFVSFEILICLFLFGFFLWLLGKEKNWTIAIPPKRKTCNPNIKQNNSN
jgi:hypothetical protein